MKHRDPWSFEDALVRIADRIGWREVARIGRRTDRTVRDWGDPDSPRTPPIATAAALDAAWLASGGIGAPFRDAHDHLLATVARPADFDPARLGDATIACIREGGQAEQALVQALLPGATPAERRVAAREVADGIAAYAATLPLLAAPRPPRPPP